MNTRVSAFIVDLFIAGICRYDFTTTVERINYEGGVRTVKSVPMGQKELKAIARALLKMGISIGGVRQFLEVDPKYTDEQVIGGSWIPGKGVLVSDIVAAVETKVNSSFEKEDSMLKKEELTQLGEEIEALETRERVSRTAFEAVCARLAGVSADDLASVKCMSCDGMSRTLPSFMQLLSALGLDPEELDEHLFAPSLDYWRAARQNQHATGCLTPYHLLEALKKRLNV